MLMKNLLLKITRTATAVVLVFVWYLGPALTASAATDEERAVGFSAQIQSSMQALEDGDRDGPRDHWDPQYVVDAVGIEPNDLNQWVRDSVRWMPYYGALRGAEGVLMDRIGNSLDQSLLLARLLKTAGHEVRLAHATLTTSTVEKLWEELKAARQQSAHPNVVSPDNGSQTAAPTEENEVLVSADLYGIDHNNVSRVVDSTNAEAESLSTTMAERIGYQTTRLAAIVGPLDNKSTAAAVIDDAKKMLADHWWVQIQREGSWVDIDPMASRDSAGGSLAQAANTFDPEALAAELEQHVIVRVIAQQLKDNSLTERTVLEQSVRPRDLLGVTIGFRHFPMAWPEKWPQVTPDDIQIKLRAALYTQTEWLPVLVLRDVVLGKAGVLDTGALDPSPHPVNPFMQMSVAVVGQISKAADVLASGGDSEALLPADPTLDAPRPPRAEGELVAERLEYEIQIPNSEPRKISREVFDLIGPAARATGDFSSFTMSGQKVLDRSMAMLGESEIQILASRIAPEFLTHLGALNAIGNRPVLDELARDPFGKLPSNFMELFSKLNGMPAALHTLAALRFNLNPLGDWVYVDRPSVVALHTRLRRAGGGDFVAQVDLDIVENAIGVDPLAGESAAILRMSQGVADTNAEEVSLQKIGNVSANTAAAFNLPPAEEDDWHVLGPGDQAALVVLGYRNDYSAQIAGDLRNGYLVVVPPPPVGKAALAGWWRIDPKTGATLGIGPTGHGQAMVEYAVILLIESVMAGAQCALAASMEKALAKTLEEKAKGSDSSKATGEGVKAGFEQVKKDLGSSHIRNQCIALGMFAGFRSLLMGFALHAVKTRGDRGYDGSKNSRRQNNGEPNTLPPPRPNPLPVPPTPIPPQPKPAPPTPKPAPTLPQPAPPTPKPAPPQPTPAPPTPKPAPSPPPPRVPTPSGKELGPYQSDPVGLKQIGENSSFARDTIGPIERFQQADRQSKLTYDSVRGDNKSPSEARKISEEAWWDSYKNFYTAPLPPNLSSPRGVPGGTGSQSPLSSTLPAPLFSGKTAPVPNAANANQNGGNAARTAGLAGLAGALEPIATP